MYLSCVQEAANFFGVSTWAIERNIIKEKNYKHGKGKNEKFGVTALSYKNIERITKNKKEQKSIETNACMNIMAFSYLKDKNAGVQVSWPKDINTSIAKEKNNKNNSIYDYGPINWNEVRKLRSLPVQEPLRNICIDAAAEKYHIPYYIFVGILKTEGGQVGHVNDDANGSYDIGPAQVNSIHLPWLASLGISEHKLEWNACENVFVGARILSEALNGADKANPENFWRHVGDYNSDTPYYNQKYSRMVYDNIKRLFPKAFD